MVTISNVDKKSFSGFSLVNPKSKELISLKPISVFFGRNGSGKSALSEYVQGLFAEDECSVFNTDYVNLNIKAHETLQGTSLIIGKEQIDNSKKIKYAEATRDKLIETLNEDKVEVNKLKLALSDRMKEIIDKTKAKFKVDIRQKPGTTMQPLEAIRQWKNEIDKNEAIRSDYTSVEDLEKEYQELAVEKNKLCPIFQDFDDNRRVGFVNTLNKTIFKPNSSVSNQVAKWLEEGLDLHHLEKSDESEEKCLFCGNTFLVSDVKTRIETRISSQYANFMKAANALHKELHDNYVQIQELSDEISEESKEVALKSIKYLSKKLNEKENNTQESVSVDTMFFDGIDELNKKINNRINLLEKEMKNNQIIQGKVQDIAKKKVGETITSDFQIKQIGSNLKSLTIEATNDKRALEVTEHYLEQDKNKQSDLNGFKKVVNQILASLGMDFELQFDGSEPGAFNIVLCENNENNIGISSLSEGEIRLVAFIKFYLSLFSHYDIELNSKSQLEQFNPTIKEIILDDPITSIDSNNRYFMTTLINRLLGKILPKNIQAIILTHSVYDFHNFAYGFNDDQVLKYRIFKNTEDNSIIEEENEESLKNYSDDYHAAFIEVAKFCMQNRNDLPEIHQYLRFGNLCRFILETHARSNYNSEYVTKKSLNEIMAAYQVNKQDKGKVSTMLDVINVLSHGISFMWDSASEVSPKEIQNAARTMIRMLSKKDEEHVKAMSNGYWRKLKNQMNNWNI